MQYIYFLFFLLFRLRIVWSDSRSSKYHSVYAFENATYYKFIKKWGGAGSEDGQFLRPHDLDFNKEETILYAVDRDGSRIQAFDKDGNFFLNSVKMEQAMDRCMFHMELMLIKKEMYG